MSTLKMLENAILADPNDVAARSAFADCLVEQGDPRGELIQIQEMLQDESLARERRKELQSREKTLVETHQHEWLGTLGPILTPNPMVRHPEEWNREVPNYQYRFAGGFLDSLHITWLALPLARALRQGTQARLLRELARGTKRRLSRGPASLRTAYRRDTRSHAGAGGRISSPPRSGEVQWGRAQARLGPKPCHAAALDAGC